MNSIKVGRLLLLLLAVLLAPAGRSAAPVLAATPTPPAVRIQSPLPGEALQGQVTVTGVTQVEGFRSAEIAFAYQVDATNTWFLLNQASAGVADGVLAQWDTTTISDGIYRLRVQVFLADGQVLETRLEGLRVRNYSPIETSTPAAELPPVEVVLPTPTHTPLPDFHPPERTPQALPTNPARLTPLDLQTGMITGAGLAAAALLLAGVYIAIKSIFRRIH